ncbi:hypothetical protein AAFC00_000003 [Neodothiora populina]|uniref:Peptidase S53 domain-containing protein n=1 Tax=Neodothiora populina TaxID=2781224 RepID=A0ABR3P1L9_9PEZI
MIFASLLTLTALGPLCVLGLRLRDQLPGTPSGWSVSSTPAASQPITLKLVLKQQNVDQLESLLASVSDPLSPKYGQYYTADQVNAIFAPSSSSVDTVKQWSRGVDLDYNIDQFSHFNLKTTIGDANQIFGANFLNYRSEATGDEKLRTLSYSVPDSLDAHVDFLTPTTFFGGSPTAAFEIVETDVEDQASQLGRRATDCVITSKSGNRYLAPDCWKKVYNITYVPDASTGSRIGFGSFLNEAASQNDLLLFEQRYGIPTQNFSVELINGGIDNQDPNYSLVGEANLDVQNMVGLGHPLPVTEFITGGSPPFIPNLDEPTDADNSNEPYLEYYDYLLSRSNEQLPQVISNSYGDDEQTVPIDYAKRVCNMIGMMGLRGITILESSGDAGVGAPCQANGPNKTAEFTPTFPGSCPYVVSVGGTQSIDPEIAWTGSAGGFSNYFAQAWYQKSAVQAYLDQYISPEVKAYYAPYTNFSGRGFPDISAHSSDPYWPTYSNGRLGLTSGTSASAPAWGAIIGLLNDARFKAGQPALGFANPLFYAMKSGFLDVTLGQATGCTGVNSQTGKTLPGSSIIAFASWNATIGWDPVTGVGLPNVGLMLDAMGLSAYNKSAKVSCPSWNNTQYTASTGSTYAIECGIDHNSSPFSTVYVNATNSLDNCIMVCEGTTGCTDVQVSGRACYLKSSVGKAVYKSGAKGARLTSQPTGLHAVLTAAPSCPSWNNTIFNTTSGNNFIVECGIDHYGGVISMTYVSGGIQACIAACEQTAGCVDASLSGSACYLKSTVNKAVANSQVRGARLISSALNNQTLFGY